MNENFLIYFISHKYKNNFFKSCKIFKNNGKYFKTEDKECMG